MVSCQKKKTEKLITGSNYKYWLLKKTNSRSNLRRIFYFDINGNFLVFFVDSNMGFYQIKQNDLEYNNKWEYINPETITINEGSINIILLNDSIFVYSDRLGKDTLITAPNSLIPLKYRRIIIN